MSTARVFVPGTNATSNTSVGAPDVLVAAIEAMLVRVKLVTALHSFMGKSLVVAMTVNMAPTVPLMLRLACPLVTTMPRKGGTPQKVDCARLVEEEPPPVPPVLPPPAPPPEVLVVVLVGELVKPPPVGEGGPGVLV